MKTSAPGDKALNTANRSDFRKGASAAGSKVDAKMRQLPKLTSAYDGTVKQPFAKGQRTKHFHAQAVPKIPRSSQMSSGT